jgi:hypothetical protein
MAVFSGSSIVTDSLILDLDAGNPKSFAPAATTVSVLIVAGGGAGGGYGGNDGSGGGGAGGLVYSSSYSVTSGTPVTVTVGAGGASATTQGALGGNGGNSVFGTLTAIGGGGGGTEGAVRVGQNGGSGGGAGGYAVKSGGTAQQSSSASGGFGNAGGDCTGPGDGGGGGAGAVGQSGTTGIGGAGLSYSISGTPTHYAGGGGASGDKRNPRGAGGGVGGVGGGGKGQDASISSVPVSGTANTGGGGGGAAGSTATYGAGTSLASGAGGTGVVIIRYAGPQKATGGTVTTVAGYTIHTFTTVGTSSFTPGTNWGDLSSNSYTGVLTNGPTYNSANGGSLAFNGSNNYVTTPSIALDLSFGVSMEMVFKSADIQSRAQGYMSMSPGPAYINFYSAGTSALRWETWQNAGSLGGAFFSPSTLANNTWYHAIGTFYNGISVLYINGVAVNSASYTAAGYGATYTAPIVIGQYAGYLSGNIAIAKMYNRALTATEVYQNFCAVRGRFGI